MRQDRRAYWAKVVAEQQAAGQTVKAFCGERGLSLYSFYVWRRKLSRKSGAVRPRVREEMPTAPDPVYPLV
jgi:hypothetical protein